jgi:diguanylate cyclase (GGDEF)-like protein
MSDLDHFKKLNDTYRHQAGDHVLRETAALWRAVLPDTAVIGRYGGEEFICALPRDDLDRATELAELMRRQIESYVFDFEGWQLHVTASFGVAQLGRPAQTAHELIRLADEGLYAAKATGRNRVVRIPCGRDTWTAPAPQASAADPTSSTQSSTS